MSNSRVLLITGASSDIGLELIRSLIDRNFDIIAQYNSNSAELEKIKAEFPKNRIRLIKADLSKESDIKNLVQEIKTVQTKIDDFVHLASPKAASKRLKDLEWQDLQNHFDVQLKSAHLILKDFLPEMAKRKTGKVVFVLSSYTVGVPPIAMAHYVSAKYAMLGYMKSLASEFRTKGICINAVSPSMVDTKFLSEIPDLTKAMTTDAHPLKRLAKTTDVAPAIKFLLSEESNYITGTNLPITGGEVF